MMTLLQAQAWVPNSRLIGEGASTVLRVNTDTRTLQAGDLFVALKGDQFDGHSYLQSARSAGAVAALAERGLAEAGLPGLQVPDVQLALQQLAAAWRARFELPLISVTGSNGKTTVTQMIASILRAAFGDAALATQGNFNNHLGVPLTLLRLRGKPKAGVVEMGMNHPGEIAELAALAKPTVALVNNAQREHQEFMASVEAVARENGTVISALPADGVAVFPADEVYTPLWRELAGERKVMTFALDDAKADVSGQARWAGDHWSVSLVTPQGPMQLVLRVAGLHNVKNALAATACALAAGCELSAIQRGLEAFEPVKGRSQIKSFVRANARVALIDDSYNANPDSVRAGIDVLAQMDSPRWLVLGDMGEVGDQGPAFHREVGAYAQERGIDALWCVGKLCTNTALAFKGARHFAEVPELVAALDQAPQAASILVKGSRFMRTERVVAALMNTPEGDAHAA
jgi:UDP-N-acetylmuramoyl-tripeptide--D-alanyl-D-alanine ligase